MHDAVKLYVPGRPEIKVVAIGGGHGLSTMLRGLKRYTKDITAIVTVADDGGGSGMLREELGILPPGDIRNCILALANTEPTLEQLLNYRFTEGSLAGQSFGNLFLAAMNGISGSFDEAVHRMGDVLAITGRVLPVTDENVHLEAEFVNGSTVLGESKIFYAKKVNDCRIREVRLVPERPRALPESLEAIAQADLILLGPGSLYTSIIPNLLVEGVAEAIAASPALKIMVMNIMTQDGESEGYTGADHVRALIQHGAPGIVDVVIANNAELPESTLLPYRQEGAGPLVLDREAVEAMSMAQYMAVKSFAQGRLGLVHCMAHMLSAYYNTAHGVANAMLLATVLEFNAQSPTARARYPKIAQALGVDTRDMTEDEGVEACLKAIRDMADELGIPKTMNEIGAKIEDADDLARLALEDKLLPTNPVQPTQEQVKELYLKLFV